jgi:hypothetical protein
MSNLIISCIDGRIREKLKDLEKHIGEEHSLWLLIPGGPLAFVDSKKDDDKMLNWIDTLILQQGVNRIILVSHQHCLAYQRKLGGFFHDEREVVSRDLAEAKKILMDKFFSIQVECYLIPWKEENPISGFSTAEMP